MAAEVNKPDFSFQWASGGSIVAPSDVKIQTGWTAEVPPFQWENFSQNRQDNAILHLFQKGISEWDALSNYYFTASGVRSYVQGSDGNIYVALQDSLGQDPTTATAYWKVAFPTTGRLLRTSIYTLIAGVQNVSVDGATPTTTGATTFVPLSTTAYYEAEVQGGGGSGGGTGPQTAGTSAIAGGGGAGSYAKARITNLSSQSITVGTGGAGAAIGGNGNSGGPSSIGVLVSSPGGGGSAVGTSNANTGVQGGTGQAAAPTGGNLLSIRGGGGMVSIQSSLNVGISGAGGSSVFGPGVPGTAVINTNGPAGTNPGTGSGGSYAGSSNPTGQATLAGAAGIIVIKEYA